MGILMLCGCGGREIDDVAYVVAIGIDRMDGNYEFTFAIGNPDSINGEGEDPLVFESAVSGDIFTAGDEISARVGQEVNFSHAELLVFSKEIALGGVNTFLDELTRNLDQRPKLIPAVASGSAKETLQGVNSQFEGNPEKYLKKIFEYSASPVSTGIDSRDFLCRTKNINTGTALPKITSDDGTTATSMAVFYGDRMIGEFKDLSSYKLLSGMGEQMNCDVNGLGSMHLNQRVPPNIRVRCEDVPKIDITVILDASVNTRNPDISKDDLYLTAENVLRARMLELLEFTSIDAGVDILGFERYARKNFYTWDDWKEYEWCNRYGIAQFNLEVKLIPQKTGLVKGES
ncbi:MAG: hypothetical protein IKB50_02785 [Clostridia bacterium]|nr:hypothetical protein [Clostridia bacterium]